MRKPRSSNSVSAIQRFAGNFSVTTPPRCEDESDAETAGTRPGRSSFVNRKSAIGSGVLAAQQLVDADALGGKGLAQHRDAPVGIGRAAHENVERGIAGFRPGVDRDVTFGQHRHSGNSAWLEMMQVNMQE